MAPDFLKWFSRSNGAWRSHRRYLYGRKKNVDNLITDFEITQNDTNTFQLTWSSDRNTGEMNFVIEDDIIKRDVGYYTSDPTDSKMTMVDEDTIVFVTTYGGVTYREEIRYLGGDIRLRQTVGTDCKTKKVTVVGQYYEERL